jgi:type II secretory pathway component GspD/PulD (secretin)
MVWGFVVGVWLAAVGFQPVWAQQDEAGSTATEADASAPDPGGLVTIDFKDADIRQVLRVLSLKSGVDIVAGSDVEGLVTIKLTSVPWEEALDIILRTYGFTYERKGRIVRVMTIEALEQEALATEVFPLNYAKAKEVADVIKKTKMLSDRGQVEFDERTNTVVVADIPTSLFRVKEVIERLDQRTPQVLIEAKIIETKLEKDENLGIRWSDSFALTQTQTSYPSTFPFQADSSFGVLGDTFVTPAGGTRRRPLEPAHGGPDEHAGEHRDRHALELGAHLDAQRVEAADRHQGHLESHHHGAEQPGGLDRHRGGVPGAGVLRRSGHGQYHGEIL